MAVKLATPLLFALFLGMAVLTGPAAAAAVEAWVERLPNEAQPLAAQSIELLVSVSPECDLRWAFGGPFVYAYGKIFAFLGHDKQGLLIGLAFGAQLTDPHRRLTGTNRALIRHYRVHASADLESDALLELLGQQLDIAGAAAKQGKSGWSGKIKPKRRG